MWLDVAVGTLTGADPESLDLGVLAIDGWTDVAEVIAMVDRCHARVHVEGEKGTATFKSFDNPRSSLTDALVTGPVTRS